MSLTQRAVSGSSFFKDIRAEMNKDRGFFAGIDGGLSYVCLDTSFYRLDIFQRGSGRIFTDAATSAPTEVRAIANGQFFASYNYISTGAIQWQGEIIVGGKKLVGNPGSAPGFRYFGQWKGSSAVSFGDGTGDPSTVTPNFQAALGKLLPVVEKGVGAGAGQI